MQPKTFKYKVDMPSEYAAGIMGFNDTVLVTIDSGDPGGDETGEDSFKEYIRQSLSEWYDGAKISLIE